MNDSPRRDSESLDSKDADEIAAGNCNSPILHGQPGSVSQVGKVNVKDVADISSIDVDGVRGNFDLEMGLDTLQDMLDGKRNSELEVEQLSNCSTHENEPHLKLDFHNSVDPEANDACGGVSSPQTSQIDHTSSESPSSTESVDTNSEADECMNESTPSSPASNIAENGLSYYSLNGYGLNHCVGDSDMDDTIMEVVLHPDYVIYRDNYCMGLKLTFSQYCIQINDSTACEKEGTFNIEWEVDDLIDIKSQSIQSSGIVLMTLHLVSSNAAQSNHVSCTSGIDELKIAIADYNWSLKHKQITSLNVKYLDMWSDLLDMDVEGDENNPPVPRCYFPNFQKPFDEVVYPKGDPDAVSLSKRDVDLLLPDTYINDTIIDFYIQFLKSKMQDEEKSRFHFFNSFFFRKLADMDKNPSSASDGKAAFLRVRKWTRKVNLFEKDYIFIPVNFNLHWSLIVICHPGEVVGFNDKEPDKSLRVPCILHMDSIKGLHSGLKNLIQSYLWEEWKERKKDACGEDLSSRFLNMRFVPVVLPQQENSYDCGLFLLHYLERFLADAPFDFNPFKLTKFSNFLNLDWFPPSEAYLKRTRIQRLISELVENNGSHGGFSSDYSDDHHHSENNDSRTGVNCHVLNGETSTSHSRQGIEITLLSASSSLDPQSLNTSGMVLKELFEPGAKAGSLPGQCQSIDQQLSDHRPNGSIFTMEENTDFSEQLMYTTTDPNIQQVTGISPQSCSLPYLPTARGKEISHGPRTSLQGRHNTESPLDTSCASDDSDDIGVIENCTIRHEASSSYEDERGENNCISIKNVAHLPDITVSAAINLPIDSLEDIPPHSNATCAGNENGDQHSSYLQHLPDISVSAAINLPIDSLEDISQHSNATCAGNKNEDQHSSCREHLPDTSVSAAINLPIDSSEDISQHSNATCAGNKNEDQHSSCLEHLPDTSVSAASNLPIDSLEDISQHTNAMCAGNKNGDQHLSCLEHLPDISVPAAINLPIDSLEEISQHTNAMCAGNKNGDQHPSCLETPTIQLPEVSDAIDDSRTTTLNLHQVSDAVDDEVSRDDVQMMDDMEPDICEEPAVKKRRLTSLQDGSDGVQTESNL